MRKIKGLLLQLLGIASLFLVGCSHNYIGIITLSIIPISLIKSGTNILHKNDVSIIQEDRECKECPKEMTDEEFNHYYKIAYE